MQTPGARLSGLTICVLIAAALGASCSSGGGGKKNPDGGRDAATSNDAPVEVACTGSNAMRKPNGQACGCNGDCQSGFCVDGVCCNSACTDTCKSCNSAAALGTCSFVAAGQPPRAASVCPKGEASSCGLDGTCDGAGACRKYPAGTVCRGGSCDGAAVTGIDVCDGSGRCKPGPATICAPFNCDPSNNKCFPTCKADTECVSGQKCVNGSCGKKPRAAICTRDTECASGFCADGVCCNVACKGGCVTCNQVGREGTCWPIDQGNPDPRQVCRDEGAATCGTTGTCDGFGGCAKYPAETICVAPSCSGDRLNTAGTCDGLGTCRSPGVRNCPPYRCIDGACNTRCATDADCAAGRACVNGSCGPKPDGQACAAASECASNFCVDGVCCADACQGACRSCALPSSLGKCASIPNGSNDPRNMCADQGPASCANDGKCDGAGGCRKYKVGTICAAETCAGNVYTPPGTCGSTGSCVHPDALPCAPFACNGSKCFTACTNNSNCVSPNICNGNSCGKAMNGAFCSDKSECASGNCAQGVCCASACASACKSCALSGSMGICTNVAAGAPDPANTCLDQGPASCGTNGKCEAGACQKYGSGTPCRDASCMLTTFTPGASCDGAGTCVMPAARSCFPFTCGTAACKGTCRADADCAAPATCNNGSCGLKPTGGTCADGVECASGFCAQGVCCGTACSGTCMSCALPGSAGTCTPVPAGGTDPAGKCANMGAATCGSTGFCNGAGACQLFAAGTQCAAPTCPAGGTTLTSASTCDGAGTCRRGGTTQCDPYKCNGTTCNGACTSDADCSMGICDPTTNRCGNKKRLGQACTATADCLTGNSCVDGVCCTTSACPTCQACNVTNKEGVCADVEAGDADPHGRCAVNPPCGFTGVCNGAGACSNAPASTSCGTASCTGSTLTATGTCNGTGMCVQPSSSCGHYRCNTNGACLTSCTGDTDCIVAGETCQGGNCTNLKPNGTACTAGGECLSGHCTDGFCCGAADCGTCRSCAVTGSRGTCTALPLGTADAACPMTAASTCGTTGTCNGAGACALYPATTVCGPAAGCPAGGTTMTVASHCNGSGMCVTAQAVDCYPYTCDGTTCRLDCTADTDCAPGASCLVAACIGADGGTSNGPAKPGKPAKH